MARLTFYKVSYLKKLHGTILPFKRMTVHSILNPLNLLTMAKKAQQQVPDLTPEQLKNEEINYAFNQITNDGLQMLTPFEANKYRAIVTVDHSGNERYPNLIKESISYFWNLTLSKSKSGSLLIYYTYDNEAILKFGTVIFNRMLRSIFKHTSSERNDINIEDCVRINTDTKDIHSFYYKRMIEGESAVVNISSLEHVAA